MIYRSLFYNQVSLDAKLIHEKLQISKGSVVQGLDLLKALRIISLHNRSEYCCPKISLKEIFKNNLNINYL